MKRSGVFASIQTEAVTGSAKVAWLPVTAMFLLFMVSANPAAAQPVVSNGIGGGAWSSGPTWIGGSVPGSSDDVVIASNDSVYTAGAISCHSLTIQPGAKLAVNIGALTVTGDFSIGAGAWFYNNYTMRAWPNNAMSYTIDSTSNFVLMASGSSNIGSQRADSAFGNVYILRSGVTCSANLTIKGDLILNYNSTSSAFRGISPTVRDSIGASSLTHRVFGNVRVITGIWSAVDGNNNTSGKVISCVWNVDGNVTVGDYSTLISQARFGPFSSADADVPNFGAFNIGGDLTIVNGARLQPGNSTSNNSTNLGIINLKGDLTVDSTATFATNSNGETLAINFVGDKTQTVTLGKAVSFSSSTHAITLYDTVAEGSAVQFTGGKSWQANCPGAPKGNGGFVVFGKLFFGPSDTLKGLQSFILKPGATLGTANVNGIDTAVGSIQAKGEKIFPSTANYVYNGTAVQATGNVLPSTVNDLTISNPAGVSLGGNTTIAGRLVLSGGGKLTLGSNMLTVSNSVPGAVAGDSSSYIIGNLKCAQGTVTGSYAFPIGRADGYHGASLNFTVAPSSASNLTVAFIPEDPTSAGLPAGIKGYWNAGYWTISTDGTPGGTYDLTLFGRGVPGIDTGGVVILQKEKLSDPWAVAGTGTNAGGSLATGKGITGFGILGFGYGKIVGVLSRVNNIPTKIAVANFPNPFNPETEIRFTVPKRANVTLRIYNTLGQAVATLVDGNLAAGVYQRAFNGSRFAGGIYLARLNVGNQTTTAKMLMIK